VRTVTAGADDVDGRARALDPVGELEHDVGEAAQLGDALALGTQRGEESGELDRGGVAGHDAGHRPAGLLSGEVLPTKQPGQQVGPAEGTRGRLRHARASAPPGEAGNGLGEGDRVERVRHDVVRERPASKPTVLRATGEHENRRAVEDLVLELPTQPEPTRRDRFAVEDDDVIPAGIERLDHGGSGGALAPTDDLDITSRAAPGGGTDRVPGGDVVAVQQNGDPMGHLAGLAGRRDGVEGGLLGRGLGGEPLAVLGLGGGVLGDVRSGHEADATRESGPRGDPTNGPGGAGSTTGPGRFVPEMGGSGDHIGAFVAIMGAWRLRHQLSTVSLDPFAEHPRTGAGDASQHGGRGHHGVAVQRTHVLRGALRVLLHPARPRAGAVGRAHRHAQHPVRDGEHPHPGDLLGLVPARASGRPRRAGLVARQGPPCSP
jgi:hypothetical protein